MIPSRAILIDRLGPPEVLVERPRPIAEPGFGEVLVRVLAAGVNFADLIMRQGLYGTVPPRPFSPGFEIAGEVEAVGPGVTAWRAGDQVVGVIPFGGYATRVLARADRLFPRLPSLSPAEAAAIPVVFATAWVCLFEAARARAGETVLILNAAGGVGTAAVQLARHHGLRVIGTAGGATKCAFVTARMGAEACFDSQGDWEAAVTAHLGPRGVDVALDAIGGPATASCRRLLAPLGRLVFYGLSTAVPGLRRNWLRAAWALLRTPRFHPYSLVIPNIGIFGVHLLHLDRKEPMLRDALVSINDGIARGWWRPVLDRTFPLTRDGAVAAHHYLHQRKAMGKVVLVA
jgi:NADPH:quinone reductase-like Zn-dependent oxidoreductase